MPLTLASYICIDGETNSAIDKFDLNELCGLLSITSDQIGEEIIDDQYEGIHSRIKFACSRLPTPKKIWLVRALAELIRLKLVGASIDYHISQYQSACHQLIKGCDPKDFDRIYINKDAALCAIALIAGLISEIGNAKLTQSEIDHTVCWIHNYQKLNTAEALNA